MVRSSLVVVLLLAVVLATGPARAWDGDGRDDLRAMRFRALQARGGDASIRDLLAEGAERDGIRDLLAEGRGGSIRDLLARRADATIRDLLVRVTSAPDGIRDLLSKSPKPSRTAGDEGIRDLLAEGPSIRDLLDRADTDGLRDLLLSRSGSIRDLLCAEDGVELESLFVACMKDRGVRDLLLGELLAPEAELEACVKASETASDGSIRDLLKVDPDRYRATIRDLLARASSGGIRDLLARASSGGIRDLLAGGEDRGLRDLLAELSVADASTIRDLLARLPGTSQAR